MKKIINTVMGMTERGLLEYAARSAGHGCFVPGTEAADLFYKVLDIDPTLKRQTADLTLHLVRSRVKNLAGNFIVINNGNIEVGLKIGEKYGHPLILLDRKEYIAELSYIDGNLNRISSVCQSNCQGCLGDCEDYSGCRYGVNSDTETAYCI